MFETLRRLYRAGRIPAAKLAEAVKKGWIAKAQADEIKGEK